MLRPVAGGQAQRAVLGNRRTEPFGCGAPAPHSTNRLCPTPMSGAGGQERVCSRVDIQTIPDCFMRKRLPLGAGLRPPSLPFCVYVRVFDFPRGWDKTAKKSKSRKIAAGETRGLGGFDL